MTGCVPFETTTFMAPPDSSSAAVETFISRWTAREGGAERANYQMFLSEL
jgi:hypothetical protein